MVFILFGIVGKLSAVFITIPYPVLGGASIAMFSSFTGVAISNLQVDKTSSNSYLYDGLLTHFSVKTDVPRSLKRC